mmetsp:Transcript_11294/g.19936  ORF Transcript_11294/g.19936 Transcript_11294/m.19936 type:complete len:220 (-) Transcript_11294:420-1079(-)
MLLTSSGSPNTMKKRLRASRATKRTFTMVFSLTTKGSIRVRTSPRCSYIILPDLYTLRIKASRPARSRRQSPLGCKSDSTMGNRIGRVLASPRLSLTKNTPRAPASHRFSSSAAPSTRPSSISSGSSSEVSINMTQTSKSARVSPSSSFRTMGTSVAIARQTSSACLRTSSDCSALLEISTMTLTRPFPLERNNFGCMLIASITASNHLSIISLSLRMN